MNERFIELIKKYNLRLGYKGEESGIIVGKDLRRGSGDHIFIKEHKSEIMKILFLEKEEERNAARAKRDKEFEQKFPDAVAESRRTGKPVAYRKDVIPCNNPNEECNWDLATFYVEVTEQGFKYTIGNRRHTW